MRTPVYLSPYLPGVIFWIPWSGPDANDASVPRSMRAEEPSPSVRSRHFNGPAQAFSVPNRLLDMLVRMPRPGHCQIVRLVLTLVNRPAKILTVPLTLVNGIGQLTSKPLDGWISSDRYDEQSRCNARAFLCRLGMLAILNLARIAGEVKIGTKVPRWVVRKSGVREYR